ncbi:alpha/beta fold hydrolase [Rhodomicrobium vannielii ATCC 17100]|uniref:alpha/beta hydrolase n=1 Tax=Rhodomicrobium vannielii TaxID=1069 RepID=UPI00191A5635|nr:alpha/beta fold hydrolase [Rhodomicrobium vannielii]MBJ7536033.1 alpha/beta fold hydrolase [Rhodomicrobium vannielii ATCC 17100]
MTSFRIIAAAIALACIAFGLWRLEGATQGLVVTRMQAGDTPVTVFRAQGSAKGPVVLIAHGFAGSQQLMQPFAITLARNGYIAVTYDSLGHGRNPEPMRGDITKVEEGPTPRLLAQVGEVAALAKTLPESDGRIAVLGHSMSSDIVVRFAQAHPEVAAVVAVSMFSPVVTPTSPKNLAAIDGAAEFGMLHDEARRVVGMVSGGAAEPGVIYGSFADGSARRFTLSPGAEHIGVLYSATSMEAALDWLNRAFGMSGSAPVEDRGTAIAALFFGVTLLAWPLASLLPRVSPMPLGAGLPWRRFWPVAVAPALLTPLILWKMPTGFLPVVLGDYIAMHFACYGLVTLAALWIATRGEGMARPPVNVAFMVAAALVAAYSILAFGLPLDRYVLSFFPIAERLPLLFAVLGGTILFFLADEWLTRGHGAATGGYPATKALFLSSLALAVALNFGKLFFLILIIPIIFVFFVIYGLFSGWVNRRTNDPLVAGLANALAFAWAIAVTFPLVRP